MAVRCLCSQRSCSHVKTFSSFNNESLTLHTEWMVIDWVSSKDNAQRDSLCGTSSHCQFDSNDDPPNVLEKSTEWKFEAHLYFAVCRWAAGDTYEDTVRQLWRSSIYQLILFLSTTWKCFTIWRQNPTGDCRNCQFEAMYRQNRWANNSGENG